MVTTDRLNSKSDKVIMADYATNMSCDWNGMEVFYAWRSGASLQQWSCDREIDGLTSGWAPLQKLFALEVLHIIVLYKSTLPYLLTYVFTPTCLCS